MSVAHLAWANIRKGKSASISLLVLIFVANLLLGAGVSVMLKMSSFYDDKVEELHDPHMVVLMRNEEYQPRYEQFLRQHAGVTEVERQSILYLNEVKFRFGESDTFYSAAIVNADRHGEISPLKFVERLDASESNDIYASYNMKGAGGYELGDILSIYYLGEEYLFRIAGFYETTMMGTNTEGMMKFLMPDAAYGQLASALGDSADGTMLSVRMNDADQSSKLLNEYMDSFPRLGADMNARQHFMAEVVTQESALTVTINILAMILVAFAALIVLVSMIVIKFRVTNMINDGIVNMGVLKAIGYTSRQIMASIVLQFMIIALAAGIAGGAAATAGTVLFDGIITAFTGLRASGSFDGVAVIVSLAIVSLSILAVVLMSAMRLRKLHPVIALRGGLTTHSNRRNYMPLDRSRGGLQFVLAIKAMLSNAKHNVMIALIVVILTFASVFSMVLYYNISHDQTAFLHLVGAETSNLTVKAKGSDASGLMTDIDEMDGVKKTVLFDTTMARLDDRTFPVHISDNFDRLNNPLLIEGRHPQFDNEIAVSVVVSQRLGKSIGDTVSFDVGDVRKPMLITGMTQSMNDMGEAVYLKLTGMQQFVPDYSVRVFHVYLEGVDNPAFTERLNERFGDRIDSVIDIDAIIVSQSASFISSTFSVMVVILTITALVVTLILYLVISATILKRKREFGILKATGYTTLQLMSQITISFIPVILAGVAIGGWLGGEYTNTMLQLLLSGTGVQEVDFLVHIPNIVYICGGLVTMAYVVSMLVARRIKRISAYGLITE